MDMTAPRREVMLARRGRRGPQVIVPPVSFRVLRLSPLRLQFPGVDQGGGIEEVPVVAENIIPGKYSIVAVKTPAVTVWQGPGRGMVYAPVRFEVYRLESRQRDKDPRARTAVYLLSIPIRESRQQRRAR